MLISTVPARCLEAQSKCPHSDLTHNSSILPGQPPLESISLDSALPCAGLCRQRRAAVLELLACCTSVLPRLAAGERLEAARSDCGSLMPSALPLYILTLRPTAFVVAQAGMVLAEGRGGPAVVQGCCT